jgi:hypothetical protein
MNEFNSKIFNPEVFRRYVEAVPRLKQNALLKAGVLRVRPELAGGLTEHVGGNYITIPMKGLIGGEAINYDGETDIVASETGTFAQSMVVVGRAKAWEERDFSYDITGEDFMSNVASQVSAYWDDIDQDTLLSILKGVFSMTGKSKTFVDNHTLDISTAEGDANKVGASTLNTAIQKATGDNKNIFTVAIMHSAVATSLENLNLLEYLKYTDANGVQRDLGLATWNGRTVLIDDNMPVEGGKYTTYLLGQGAFDYCDIGAKVPYEMVRDALIAGGKDILVSRQRKLFAPHGISFTKSSMAKLSPTNGELETPANWTLALDAKGESVINHKSIPIARIISLG